MQSYHGHAALSGWYPDPVGQHQWRFFDDGWTDLVIDDGRTGRSPLPGQVGAVIPGEPAGAAPATAAGPATAGMDTPTGPIPLGVPSTATPDPQQPGRARRRALVIGIAAAAVVAIVVAVALATSGGDSDDRAGANSDITGDFCTDFPANYGPIDSAWQTATTVAHDLSASADRDHDVNQLSKAAALTRQLAGEAPNTTDEFGDPLPGVIGNWADFFAATKDLAADDGSDYQKHADLLDKAQRHESESTPSLLKQTMFPDPGLPALRSCG